MLPLVTGEFRVGGEPNLRFAPSGTAVCRIRAVASSRKKDESGEWKDDKTAWVDLVGFKRLAENMAESFKQGDLVVITGKLQVEDWEDNEGNKRKSVNVVLDTIGMSAAWNPVAAIKTERQSQGGGNTPSNTQSNTQQDPWQSSNNAQSDEPPF